MPDRSDQIKALASESRMEILRLLADPPGNFGHQESADPAEMGVCMNLIAERLKVSQPTISRHIELLRRAGFLTIRRQQKWSYCARDEAVLAEYHQWLSRQLRIKRWRHETNAMSRKPSQGSTKRSRSRKLSSSS